MGRKERAKLIRNSLNLRILNPELLRDEAGVQLALEQLDVNLCVSFLRRRHHFTRSISASPR